MYVNLYLVKLVEAVYVDFNSVKLVPSTNVLVLVPVLVPSTNVTCKRTNVLWDLASESPALTIL